MSLFTDIKQNKVMHYFEMLSKVPRGSYNSKGIADFLVDFANSNNLKCYRDDTDNVVIYKDGTKTGEPVVLQGHTDIVCDSINNFDFENSPIKLIREGDMVTADGTTLGADNGIACAMMMAILSDNNLLHPPIECVFTSDEEVGLLGATALDCSKIKGKTMLNIDSECEGVFTAGCAGGASISASLNFDKCENKKNTYKLSVTGLDGGHSGVDIDKNRCSAIKLAFDIVKRTGDCNIVSVNGGSKENAIPSVCEIVFASDNVDTGICDEFKSIVTNNYSDSDCNILIEQINIAPYSMNDNHSKKLIDCVVELPNGIRCMNASIPTLVQTSSNIGVVATNDDNISLDISVRSSVTKEKSDIADDIKNILQKYGFEVKIHGDYPSWEFIENSELRDTAVKVFENMYNKKPVIDVIHAGLECGIFSDKIKNLDCISYGPDLLDIHTVNERMSISSVMRVYDFTVELLKNL